MSLRAAHFAAKQSPFNEAAIATPPHLPSHSLRFGDCVAGGARENGGSQHLRRAPVQ
jgi:hypothetical protein